MKVWIDQDLCTGDGSGSDRTDSHHVASTKGAPISERASQLPEGAPVEAPKCPTDPAVRGAESSR